MNPPNNPPASSLSNLDTHALLALIDAAPDPMLITDADGQILLASAQVEQLLGYEPARLVNQPIEILLPQRFRQVHPGYRENYGRAARSRAMGSGMELTALHKNGDEIPVEVSLSPVSTPNGLLVCSSIRDISDHRQKEQNLTSIIETSLNEIYLFDVNSLALVQANLGARENLGYEASELLQLSVIDLLPRHNTSSFTALVEPLVSGRVSKLEISLEQQRKNKTRYPVEMHLQRSFIDTQEVFVAIVLDTTERHQAEAQLRAANEQLEQKVAERTAELESANATKSRFLAAASHDLRQPLQSLGLYLSVAERMSEAPKQLEVASKMRSSLETMGELLDALLDISRFDGDATIAEKRDFALQESIDRLIIDNRLQAEQKGLQLQGCSTNAIVHSDQGLLERVIENFITNAIRYTAAGTVSLACSKINNAIAIDVIDTGIGIPTEDQSKIFEEYYQLDNPVRDRRKGLGLGLAIVKHISRMLEHPVSVVSTPGLGSTFRVLVPLAEAQNITSEPQASERAAPEVRSLTLLLVDDDPAVLDATSMLLEDLDYTVIACEDAPTAIQRLQQGDRPHGIISDYRLPGMSGVELILEARSLLETQVPAIVITGDTTTRELTKLDVAQCTLLHKPIDIDKLIQLIEAIKIE